MSRQLLAITIIKLAIRIIKCNNLVLLICLYVEAWNGNSPLYYSDCWHTVNIYENKRYEVYIVGEVPSNTSHLHRSNCLFWLSFKNGACRSQTNLPSSDLIRSILEDVRRLSASNQPNDYQSVTIFHNHTKIK